MNINREACEISIKLSKSIPIHGKGGQSIDAETALFGQPNRRSAGIFQNLLSMFTRAVEEEMRKFMDSGILDNVSGEQTNQEQPQEADPYNEDAIKAEIESMLNTISSLDFDFDKAYNMFEKILLSGDKRGYVCRVGGMPINATMIEKVDYRDLLRMMVTYIVFFGMPASTGTKNESEMQQDSAMQVTEL